jgi:ubiquinone/menaquinone biosynthesis C-methylase UbiE
MKGAMIMAGGQEHDRYIFGYDSGASTHWHVGRTASNQAAFFLPHLQRDIRVLDCGCGPGSITMGLADVVHPGAVVGVDIGAAQIERAKSESMRRGIANVSFEEEVVARFSSWPNRLKYLKIAFP